MDGAALEALAGPRIRPLLLSRKATPLYTSATHGNNMQVPVDNDLCDAAPRPLRCILPRQQHAGKGYGTGSKPRAGQAGGGLPLRCLLWRSATAAMNAHCTRLVQYGTIVRLNIPQ